MLDKRQKQRLKAQAHGKKPVVIVGANGVTEALVAETERALNDHELIKIRVNVAGRAERQSLIDGLLSRLGAELVQRVGHIAVVYRQRSDTG